MTRHTEGKWVVREHESSFTIGQDGDGGKLIAETAPFFSYLGAAAKETARANARRIVACVNACEGMETEHLENQSMLGETLLDRFNLLKSESGKLTKQRDELLEALEAFSNYIHAEQCSTDGPVHYSDGQLTGLAIMARKAIAKAKGLTK